MLLRPSCAAHLVLQLRAATAEGLQPGASSAASILVIIAVSRTVSAPLLLLPQLLHLTPAAAARLPAMQRQLEMAGCCMLISFTMHLCKKSSPREGTNTMYGSNVCQPWCSTQLHMANCPC